MSRPGARDVSEVGKGDYVKIGSQWKRIASNSAEGARSTPRSWTIRTEDGGTYGMWDVNAYAKAGDLKTNS